MGETTHTIVLKSERYGLEVFLFSSETEANEHKEYLADEYSEHGIEILEIVEVDDD